MGNRGVVLKHRGGKTVLITALSQLHLMHLINPGGKSQNAGHRRAQSCEDPMSLRLTFGMTLL